MPSRLAKQSGGRLPKHRSTMMNCDHNWIGADGRRRQEPAELINRRPNINASAAETGAFGAHVIHNRQRSVGPATGQATTIAASFDGYQTHSGGITVIDHEPSNEERQKYPTDFKGQPAQWRL